MVTPITDVLDDLRTEYARIDALLASLTNEQWETESMAPGWSVNDTVLHLAMTEEAVALTIASADPMWTTRDVPLDDFVDQSVRDHAAPAPQVFERWRAATASSLAALEQADPDQSVTWAAAPLKPRTLATTRLAEHWAHALDIVEPLRLDFPDTDRLRHIAWLGHATLPYAFALDDLEPNEVFCTLTAPSGAVFTFGPADAASTVSGDIGAFCRVGARRVAGADSGLATSGPHADAALRVLRNYAA